MICNKKLINYINGDQRTLDNDVFPILSRKNEIVSFKNNRFWKNFDKENDINILNNLWESNNAPWEI